MSFNTRAAQVRVVVAKTSLRGNANNARLRGQLRSFLWALAFTERTPPSAFFLLFLRVELYTRASIARLMQIRANSAFAFPPRLRFFPSVCKTPRRDTANYTVVNRPANLSPAIRPSEFQRSLSRVTPRRPLHLSSFS